MSDLQKAMDSLQKTLQAHHDHYVRLSRQGELDEEDRPQFILAMDRESKGIVKPLEEPPADI